MKEEVEECVPAIPADADHAAKNEQSCKLQRRRFFYLVPSEGNQCHLWLWEVSLVCNNDRLYLEIIWTILIEF